MIVENSVILASRLEIFQYIEDYTSWKYWNPALSECDFPHGIRFKSKGWVRKNDGQKFKITISHIDFANSINVNISYPLGSLLMEGSLREMRNQTKATISARFEGILAPVYRSILEKKVQLFVRSTLDGLSQVAEQGLMRQMST